MSDTVENDSGLSAREVEEQPVQLSDADWARARRFANFLSRSPESGESQALFYEFINQDGSWLLNNAYY
ncbi:hypothetical protein PQQ65_28995 [Paraburkholderia strydomiana]|uniref:hypothetical protein n=1 Tax=Paraburkholderia strydomiana TaxID=1245417 RepID=UPI0038B9AA25